MAKIIRQGLVTRVQSRVLHSPDRGKAWLFAGLRGRLKKGRATGDIAAVGDQVEIMLQPDWQRCC